MIDHRPAQTPVRHQGDRPTCVGFAVSAAHEWAAADGEIRSVEQAIWAGHQIGSVPGREETTVGWSLTGLALHGHTSEEAWPYGTPHWSSGPPAAALEVGSSRALPAWRRLPVPGFDAVRDALERGQPVVLTVRVVRPAWRTAGGLIDAEPGRKTPGNHAVIAVAVTQAFESPEQIVIKNSWGPHWGDAGYGALSRRYFDYYTIAAHILEAS